MNGLAKLFTPALLLALAATLPAVAYTIEGADKILCTASRVNACFDDGECVEVQPWELNIPRFIEIDFKEKKLATTKASGQNRSTPIKYMERAGGLVFLQGVEGGRAFSFVVDEATGLASIAVARDGVSVAAFAACTPISR